LYFNFHYPMIISNGSNKHNKHKCYSVIGADYKKILLSDYNRKITRGRLVAPDVD
jgi:hypothetical protein